MKIGVGLAAILALLGSLIAVYRLDRAVARGARRWAPVGWWRPTRRDITVFVVLGLWR